MYILRSVTNELYIGQTNDLEKRLQYHKSGNGAVFTKVYKTSMLEYSEKFKSRAEAEVGFTPILFKDHDQVVEELEKLGVLSGKFAK